jgi:hypothetical protein
MTRPLVERKVRPGISKSFVDPGGNIQLQWGRFEKWYALPLHSLAEIPYVLTFMALVLPVLGSAALWDILTREPHPGSGAIVGGCLLAGLSYLIPSLLLLVFLKATR